jgi:hypothetical protein
MWVVYPVMGLILPIKNEGLLCISGGFSPINNFGVKFLRKFEREIFSA